jgi:hypothetical protein
MGKSYTKLCSPDMKPDVVYYIPVPIRFKAYDEYINKVVDVDMGTLEGIVQILESLESAPAYAHSMGEFWKSVEEWIDVEDTILNDFFSAYEKCQIMKVDFQVFKKTVELVPERTIKIQRTGIVD